MPIKTFATEEEKNTAIEEFDERTGGGSSVLDEIMNAEIKPLEDGVIDAPFSEETSDEPKPDDSLTTDVVDQLEPNIIEPKVTEVEILKEQLAEKNKYIQDNFANQDNLKTLEDKVLNLESAYSERAPQSQKKEVELRESKIAELQTRRKNLQAKFSNPEDQLSQEFVDESNGIQDALVEELVISQHNFSVVQDQVKQATDKTDSYVDLREREDLAKRQNQDTFNEEKAIEDFSEKTPQFKLSKPFKDVAKDFVAYQKKVSGIYLGREPNSRAELDESMNQLKRGSPNLLAKLKVAGVGTEPTPDMTKYLGLCEVWDHWTGFRKDPITGDYDRDKSGNIVALTRYEPTLKKRVPDRYPSVEAAYNDKSAQEGFYVKQLIKAKIEGGKKAIDAISQRDRGATELGATETSGGQLKAVEDAWNRINEIDEVEAMRMAQDGKPDLLNEFNILSKAVGWEEVPNPMA